MEALARTHTAPKKAPPSLNYYLDWATPFELAEIVPQMEAEGYQTMNLRLYSASRLILLKDIENNGRIVGRAGLDMGHGPMPEMFSFMVHPDYRGFQLGVVLNQARAAYIASRGFPEAYCRMNAKENAELKEYRVNTGVYREMVRDELDARWVSYCSRCELFRGPCVKQAYFSIDIAKLLKYSEARVGGLLSPVFPKQIRLGTRPTEMLVGRPRYMPRWSEQPLRTSLN